MDEKDENLEDNLRWTPSYRPYLPSDEADELISAHELGRVLDTFEDVRKLPNAEELRVLHIRSQATSEVSAIKFRMLARLTSQLTNMPFAVYANTSGGVNTGFFFRRSVSFAALSYYFTRVSFGGIDFCAERNLEKVGAILVRFLQEFDPEDKYETYYFGL
jgi:hypothetical protein